jgi:adenosylhomocysteine nucleosidase
MIVLFHAFARELAPLRKKFEGLAALTEHGLRGFRGRLKQREISAIATGIGAGRARDAATRAIAAYPNAELVISSGVAGALSEGLEAGDLIIADQLMIGREDHTAQGSIAIDPVRIKDLERALDRGSISYSRGAMLTTLTVLAASASKRMAKERSGAIAVDMESAVIGEVFAAADRPFLCIRAILDAVGDELPGAELSDSDGRVKPGAAVGFFLRNPGAIMKMPRLIANLSRATAALSRAIEAICQEGGAPPRSNSGRPS